ncbi:hypothetical protein LZ32DRAFT_604570 [Colletotrichum eremochloae]|nr:hypothetical protein LZ32DRAFT_604570 [Colletotrichum eremochloae]
MPSMYRNTAGYRWYSDGNERPNGLVSHETDDQGRVIIAAGEVWCRVAVKWSEVPSDNPNDPPERKETLCFDRHLWSSLGALKKHLKEAHDLEVAPSAAGSLKAADDQKAAIFYDALYKLSQGIKVELNTPRKANAILNDRVIKQSPSP